MVIQLAPLEAVQLQEPVIETLPLAAALLYDLLVGEIAKLQLVPACVTVTVWPATVSVPVREAVSALAWTE